MVNMAAFSAVVMAYFDSFGTARNCTPNLYYCGNYYDDIKDALAATKQGICADRKHGKNSLFYCAPGTTGYIKYNGYCSKGCKNMGVDKSDKC